MKPPPLKVRIGLIIVFIFFGSLLLLDSCMQFRMSSKEIDTYFSELPVHTEQLSYREGNRVINYVIAGNDQLPLVVFIHGSPGSLSAFIHFLKDDTLLKYVQMITVDRPGFGASNFGHAEPSLEKQSRLLKPLLERHKQDRHVILVGHSLGGPLIGRMAMDYPELIDGLIMVAPSIDPELEPNEWFRGPFAMPFLKLLLPRSIRASNDEIWQLKPQLQEMVSSWSSVRTKTIIIQGEEDSLVPAANADFAEKMMTEAPLEVVRVKGMDHFVPWSNPSLITNAILKMVPLHDPMKGLSSQ